MEDQKSAVVMVTDSMGREQEGRTSPSLYHPDALRPPPPPTLMDLHCRRRPSEQMALNTHM